MNTHIVLTINGIPTILERLVNKEMIMKPDKWYQYPERVLPWVFFVLGVVMLLVAVI